MTKPVEVSLAFITNNKGQILIAKRAKKSDMAGYWEFPGGKIEQNETAEDALKRELLEELGIVVEKGSFVTQLTHAYPHRTVSLHVFHVSEYVGAAHCCEDQEGLEWVYFEHLSDYPLLEAGFRLLPFLAPLIQPPVEVDHA